MTHVKNAEAFSRLVDFCTGYGGTYNPGRQSLHIEVLVAQLSATRQAMQQVITAKAAFDNEVNFRKQVFDRLAHWKHRVQHPKNWKTHARLPARSPGIRPGV